MGRKLVLCTILLVGLAFCALNQPHPTVFLVGDSTVSDFAERYAPMVGWGTTFQEFFSSELAVDNRAIAGQSSRSFIEEGKWSRVLKDIKRGDYLMIQFGHSDQKKDYRHTDPYGTYQDFLTQYIRDTRRQGGIPVLVTSVMRRRFRDGKLYDTHGEYPKAVRQLAKELDVPLIDLHARSLEYFDSLGSEATKDIFLWLRPSEAPNYPRGWEDNTHFSEHGARQVGQLVVDGLKQLALPLKDYLKDCRKETQQTITLCAGDSIWLSGDYQRTAGVYYDTLIAASGGDSIIITELAVSEPTVVPTIEATSSALSSSIVGDAYRWFFNGKAIEDNDAVLTTPPEGSYAVSVRIGSCYSLPSDAYYHALPGDTSIVTDLPNSGIPVQFLRAYQSARDYLTVDTSQPTSSSTVLRIHNLQGRRVWQDNHYWASGTREIFFGPQPTGIYVATLSTSGRRTTVKFHWARQP